MIGQHGLFHDSIRIALRRRPRQRSGARGGCEQPAAEDMIRQRASWCQAGGVTSAGFPASAKNLEAKGGVQRCRGDRVRRACGVGVGAFSLAVKKSIRIRRCDVAPLDIPLFEPFGISGGAQSMANNGLVTLVLDDGSIGYGEAAPLPAYNGETQAAALSALRAVQAWIVGFEVSDWRDLGREFRRRSSIRSGAALCALEVALIDALTRREGVPLWSFFGGAGTRLETDMTVTTGTPDEAARATRALRERRIRTIKVKIGGPLGPAHDFARIVAIREVAPRAPLILDGNAGLTRAEAAILVQLLKRAKIKPALLEQWLPKRDLVGMRLLREESGWLVAADEAVRTVADVRRIAEAGAADVVNIKLMKAGLAEAMKIVKVARLAGLELMVGGNIESILTMTVSACFAAGLGGFRFADLDTPWFLASNPFVGGYAADGGKLSVAHITAGHGVTPITV